MPSLLPWLAASHTFNITFYVPNLGKPPTRFCSPINLKHWRLTRPTCLCQIPMSPTHFPCVNNMEFTLGMFTSKVTICPFLFPFAINLLWFFMFFTKHQLELNVATPLWPSVGVKPNTPKVGDLESSGTPECLEFNSKAQNTSMRGVLSVIGKVLKRRYRKWPRIGHLDIISTSYGQKKGRESKWQLDSRPLKVGTWPLPDLWIESATRCWKDLDEGYNFDLDFVAIRLCSPELWALKVPGLQPGQFRDNFGTSTWESREKEPLGCSLHGVT
jgi:hypothetical protein